MHSSCCFARSAQREFDKKVRRRTHSYVGAGGEHVHRGSDVPNAAFAGAVTSPGAGQFMSHPPAQFQAADHRTLVDDAISRLQRVSFSEDGQSRAFRMPSSASSVGNVHCPCFTVLRQFSPCVSELSLFCCMHWLVDESVGPFAWHACRRWELQQSQQPRSAHTWKSGRSE